MTRYPTAQFIIAFLLLVSASIRAGTITVVNLPATGTDAATGISTTNTYLSCIDFGDSTSPPGNINGVPFNTEVQEYNAYIQYKLVPKLESEGKHVTFVNQYANFVNAQGKVEAQLLPDDIHPTQAGYNAMGATWAKAIESLAKE